MISTDPTSEALIAEATKNISDILTIALEHNMSHQALVVYDTKDPLTCILTEAYRRAIPTATFLDFDEHNKEEVIGAIDALAPRDLVVLIQSTDFRLNEFRFRIQLFQRKLKVIDHAHLYRNAPDSWSTYVQSLAYDPTWYRGVGWKLKHILETTSTLRVKEGDHILEVTDGLEIPKPNIGDYTGMENIGGTFPIGEVFTEAKDLHAVNGSLMIYAFANTDFNICMHEPFRIDIVEGIVTGWSNNAPDAFIEVVEKIKSNERAIIREIGFGLNRAISREHYLGDITAFERILGLHVSLGEKHTVYKKPGIVPDKTRYHVDLFPVVSQVFADDTLIFEHGRYRI